MTRTSIVLAGLLALAVAGPASAAPDRTVTLSTGHTSVTWAGKTSTSISGQWFEDIKQIDPAANCHQFPSGGPGVAPIDDCDQTLVKLDGVDPGTIDFALPAAGDGNVNDWDLFVYTADKNGKPGEAIGNSEQGGGPESVPLDDSTTSNYYLVVAVPYQSINDTYSGAVTWAPADSGI